MALLASAPGHCAVTGAQEGKELLSKLWQDIVPEAIHFVRKHLKEPVTTVDNALVASCFSIMDALLKPYVRYRRCPQSAVVKLATRSKFWCITSTGFTPAPAFAIVCCTPTPWNHVRCISFSSSLLAVSSSSSLPVFSSSLCFLMTCSV